MQPDSPPNPEAPTPAAKRRRRRFRPSLSLRSMMLLVLVVGGWTGWQSHRARAMRRAIGVIERAGGFVEFEGSRDAAGNRIARAGVSAWLCDTLGEEYVFDVRFVAIGETEPHSDPREVIRAVASIPRVRRLSMTFFDPVDEDMAAVAGMSDLEEILIWESHRAETPPATPAAVVPLSHSGLARLSRLKKLRSIDLSMDRTGVIDAHALRSLSTLPGLRSLKISQLSLEDDELQAFGAFEHLEELEIRGYRPPDSPRTSCLLPVASWGELRSLLIWGIGLTADEVRALSRLGKLEKLFVEEMGDEGLLLLREMKGLKELHLATGLASSKGVPALRAALPGLKLTVFRQWAR